MGRIGRMIKTAIDTYIVQTVEAYAGANVTANTYAPSGDDSPPLAEDRVLLSKVDGSGQFAACGVLSASQGAKPGEKILYSRAEDGSVMAMVKLLQDGTISVSGSGANLAIDGDCTITVSGTAAIVANKFTVGQSEGSADFEVN